MKTREETKKLFIDNINMLVWTYWLGGDNFKAKYSKWKNIWTPILMLWSIDLKWDADKQVEKAVEELLNLIYN